MNPRVIALPICMQVLRGTVGNKPGLGGRALKSMSLSVISHGTAELHKRLMATSVAEVPLIFSKVALLILTLEGGCAQAGYAVLR